MIKGGVRAFPSREFRRISMSYHLIPTYAIKVVVFLYLYRDDDYINNLAWKYPGSFFVLASTPHPKRKHALSLFILADGKLSIGSTIECSLI